MSVSGVKQGCIMSPWLFSVYMDAVMKGEIGDRGNGNEISGGGRRLEIIWLLAFR